MAENVLPVPLPHMGVSVEEATVVAWHKAIGDAVRADEVLCQIATDKVDTDVVAPADGVLARIVAQAGDTIAIGATLAELSIDDGAATAPAPAAPPAPIPMPVASPARFDAVAAAARALDHAGNGARRPISSPVARRLAQEHGVELGSVSGSGPRGRIRKSDVLAAIASVGSAAVAGPGHESALPAGYEGVAHEVIPTTRQRRLIAEHMIRSRQTAAHMTTEAEVDMTRAALARDALNPARAAAGEGKITYLALIAKATCAALLEFPDLNATFQTERLIRWGEINLGIAVDTDQGLIVPVIRRAERLTAPALADAIADLATRARSRGLRADETRGGTFTISNPGSVGAYSAMAIINQPQVAILGTPVIVRRPTVVLDDHGQETIGIRPIMALALTFDHRAIDGALATRCVVRIKRLLESWDAAAYA